MQPQNGFMQAQPQMMQPQAPIMMPGQNMMQLTQQQPGQVYQRTQQQPGQVYQQAQQQPLQMYQQAQQLQQGQYQLAQQQPIMYQQMEPQLMQVQPQYAAQGQMQLQQFPAQLPDETQDQPMMMAARGSHKQDQRPAHPSRVSNLRGKHSSGKPMKQPSSEEQLKVYYYDPATAIVEGQLQAPSVVYDEHGNEVDLSSLVSFGSELYIEPPHSELMASPVYGSTQSNSDNRRLIISSNSTNSTSNGPLPLPPPPLEMKFKTPEAWGESTTQDQSIIIVTVATMALLVGALSARRLRSRSFLSSCIENESLEDEVAYDNAYTISGGDSYNTFGWKGDLEKFDV